MFVVSYGFHTRLKPMKRRKRPWRWRISNKRSTIFRILAGNTWKATLQEIREKQPTKQGINEPKNQIYLYRNWGFSRLIWPQALRWAESTSMDSYRILWKIRGVRINFESKKGKRPSSKNLRTGYQWETVRLRSVNYCVKIRYFLT